MNETPWLAEFKQRLSPRRLRALDTEGDTTPPVPQYDGVTPQYFIGAILIVGLLLVAAIGYKTWSRNKVVEEPSPVIQQPIQPLQDSRLPQLERQLSSLETSMQSTRDRLAILGCLLNNNTNVIATRSPREDLVYVNADWTIDQLPKHLNDNSSMQPYLRRSKEY